jgi:hypothetical protein
MLGGQGKEEGEKRDGRSKERGGIDRGRMAEQLWVTDI